MSFRPTLPLFKQAARSKASGAWLSRQSRDPYIKSRASHPANFRSRSAFKLLEIHDVHRILTESWIRTVVDLGAAPGGWSQAVAQVYGVGQVDELSDDPTHEGHPKGDSTNEDHASQPSQTSYPPSALTVPAPTIIALDLLPILPIAGVHTLQADFLAPSTTARIASILKQSASTKPVDLLLSDMSANHTGNRATDVENILDLAKAVFRFAGPHLSTSSGPNKHPGGTLLMKYFSHPLLDSFQKKVLQPCFRRVQIVKPRASRADSAEAYWLCRGFKGSSSVTEDTLNDL